MSRYEATATRSICGIMSKLSSCFFFFFSSRSRHTRLTCECSSDVCSSDLAGFDSSELASALATEELEAARARHARRLFEQALTAPTENTVAQATWAATVGGLSTLDLRDRKSVV